MKHNFKDLTGKKFGKLTVLNLHHKEKFFRNDRKRFESKYFWLCKCDCGNEKIIEGKSIRSGRTRSCGCLNKEIIKNIATRNKKHGLKNTRLYRIWQNMKARCQIKNTENYHYYGKRGIKVCDEWKNNLLLFYEWAMNNGYQDNLTIDRIDINGNYEPANCRWVDMKTQNKNRRNNRNITYQGKTKTLAEWSEIKNVSANTMLARIDKLGRSIEKAFTTPVRKINNKMLELQGVN